MIFLIPGTGADHRMYQGEWLSLPDVRAIDWPEFKGESSLDAIALRVIDEKGITDGSVVVGCSLGGMVACEIARHRKLKALVLLSSATAPAEINGLLSLLHPLIDLAPIDFVQRASGKISSETAQMFKDADPAFVRAAVRAIFQWQGLDSKLIKPLRIHGTSDRVIHCPSCAEFKIPGGGHLIAMTHAGDCAEFIRRVLP